MVLPSLQLCSIIQWITFTREQKDYIILVQRNIILIVHSFYTLYFIILPRNDFKFIHLELCCIYLRLNAKVQNILWAASTIWWSLTALILEVSTRDPKSIFSTLVSEQIGHRCAKWPNRRWMESTIADVNTIYKN